MLLHSDQITSSVRIKTLLVYLRSLKFPQANLLSRMPRGLVRVCLVALFVSTGFLTAA